MKYYKHKKINNLDFFLKYEKLYNITLTRSALDYFKHPKIYIASDDFIAPVVIQGDIKTLILAPIVSE